MLVIAVCNSKGGVGKTTLSATLAVRASEEVPRVALVDLDPQKSLISWWNRRGRSDNPEIMEGVETASEAIETLGLQGYDVVVIDTPPAFLGLIEDAVDSADVVVIPLKASALDAAASEDAVVLAKGGGGEFLVVLNDVEPKWATTDRVREFLEENLPANNVAKTMISHRGSHVSAMTIGKTAAEINRGRDKTAVAEIDALWDEVKKAAKRGAKAKAAKARKAANVR